MKKQITRILTFLGFIDPPAAPKTELSVVKTVLKSNICRCQSYDELLSCEKMYQWYVDKYITDPLLPEFKKEIMMYLQHQRMIIQSFTSHLYGHGSHI